MVKQGHELGNHPLFHTCLKSKPGLEWLDPANSLEDKTVKAMVNEISVAITLLSALDRLKEHTFTAPCSEQMANTIVP